MDKLFGNSRFRDALVMLDWTGRKFEISSGQFEEIRWEDLAVALRWGRLTMTAKSKGFQIPVADGLIAATALHHGLTVATRNARHFGNDLGIDAINPWHTG